METPKRQDIQDVNVKAEQLNYLLQTIHAFHEKFDCHQLGGLLGLAYDLAGYVYTWTDDEEKILFAIEENETKDG